MDGPLVKFQIIKLSLRLQNGFDPIFLSTLERAIPMVTVWIENIVGNSSLYHDEVVVFSQL